MACGERRVNPGPGKNEIGRFTGDQGEGGTTDRDTREASARRGDTDKLNA